MTKIPSIEITEDFIYRLEVQKGTESLDPNDPHLLVFDQFVDASGVLHSLDFTVRRDRQRALDVEFRGFKHLRQPNMTYVKLTFHDDGHRASEHHYLLTIVLRYLV